VGVPLYQALGSVLLRRNFPDTKEQAMRPRQSTATLSPMPDPALQQRLDDLAAKREEYGVSIARLSKRAGYSSAQSWHDLLKGDRPESTLVKFERALDDILENADDQLEEPQPVKSTPASSWSSR
jgi:hypothetical protein